MFDPLLSYHEGQLAKKPKLQVESFPLFKKKYITPKHAEGQFAELLGPDVG